MENELLRQEPSGGPVTSVTLSSAIAQLNTRIRKRGLSAREMLFQRDQFTGSQLPFNDRDIIMKQHEERLANNSCSEKSKAPKGVCPKTMPINVGDLVYFHSDRHKHQGRSRYLVTSVEGEWCNIKKFTGWQLRSSSYRVRLSECYLVPSTLAPLSQQSFCYRMDDKCNDQDEELPVLSPTLPTEISQAVYHCESSIPPQDHIEDAGIPALDYTHYPLISANDKDHTPTLSDCAVDVCPRRSTRTRKRPSYLEDYVCP